MFLAIEFDLGAGVLAEQHAVFLLDVQGTHGAVFQHLAVANRDDFTLDGLLFRGVRNDDSAFGF